MTNTHTLEARLATHANGRQEYSITDGAFIVATLDASNPGARGHAQVFAAAPELLEALKQLLKTAEVQIDGLPEEMRRYAHAAIAKAECRA